MTWACAVTFWHQQEDVIEQLLKAQLEYFFPRIKRTVRHRGRRVHRLDPLLFNYLPIKLSNGNESEATIRAMRGVADMIGPVRAEEISRLKSQCDADGILVQPKIQRFRSGQPVRPLTGPLSDKVGTYVGEAGEREAALFSILGARRSIKFEVGDLVAA